MAGSAFDLRSVGWDASWRRVAAAYAALGVPGRITRVDRGACSLLTAAGAVRATVGGSVLDAMATDTVAAPCTGDWCIVRRWPDGPLTVEVVMPRRTALTRAEASGTSRGQVLASNVDVVAVVVALHPEPSMERVERLLALAWGSGATPIVVLTKADVVGDADAVADDVRELAMSTAVVSTSTVTGAGIAELRGHVGDHATLALVGASGHGKSSLANALVGAESLLTRRIRDDGKGRHTSVRRELLTLPGGGAVIDMPGLRSVGIQSGSAGLTATFVDIERLAARCAFADCRHTEEPRCAVLAAVVDGTLSVRRLASWRALQREHDEMARRSELRLRGHAGKGSKRPSKRQRAQGRLRR